ncbi:uncharacterized protein LOC110062415 isoform X3 [Orbicella faveolata]|uniref:uncharacterized protein LOC110062415 isoform X3 n=1 Tax=Orbicella faveolata TaxID=48498 RepID=UPI0009E61A60|nr:uncharacterized protein LOC110062415 isoform X3 [Orbicella faveolata]
MDKNVDDVSPTSSASREDNEADSRRSRIGTSDIQEGLQTSASPEDMKFSLDELEREVIEACAIVERVLKEREERTKRQREEVQRHRERREQRQREEREMREREEREMRERVDREAREREDMAKAELAPFQESPLWQCEHFQRRCSVRFPCCRVFYPCHRCHNGSGVCDARDKRANQATHIKCTNCGHREEINQGSQICSSCGTRMSEYFCFKCKHFTGVDKNPFHCDKCGICRIDRDRSFHCDVCNVCLDKRLEGKHKCRAVSQQDKHQICLQLQENQGHEGDALEGQRALQFNRIEDAVPGDGHGVESDNESNPESESECNVDPLSANSDNVVLRLITTAAPESQKQIDRLENALRELKKENQTLQDLLEKTNNRGDRANLPGVDAVCDDSTTRLSVPAIRHFNAGVAANVPPEPSLVDIVQGIHPGFLTRHSQDRDLCEIPQANVESHNSSLPEAGPYMVSSSEDPVSRRCIRNPCLIPSQNDCVCCENDGSQTGSVDSTIMPERCRPYSVHNMCCKCLEVVVSGFNILPCSHPVHRECLIGMIQNGELNCPICGRAFLWRG